MQQHRLTVLQNTTWFAVAAWGFVDLSMSQALMLTTQPTALHDCPDHLPKDFHAAWFLDDTTSLVQDALARSRAAPCLALLNWQGEWLRLWLCEAERVTYRYDSNPSYATCTVSAPESDNATVLCAAFAVGDCKSLAQLLQRKKGLGFVNENDRLARLLALLQPATRA